MSRRKDHKKESGANLLSQSHRVESAKPITFRHSNENRSNTDLTFVCLCYWRHPRQPTFSPFLLYKTWRPIKVKNRESPIFDGNITLLAGPTFLHLYTLAGLAVQFRALFAWTKGSNFFQFKLTLYKVDSAERVTLFPEKT